MIYQEVGVFVGVEPSGLAAPEATNVFSASGSTASITSGRLSHSLGLSGPCYSIDTACSSTLSALHLCAITMQRKECVQSVTVGTKILSKAANLQNSVAGMTSLLGRCLTFDVRADGYCRGEGCSALYLRTSGELVQRCTAVRVVDSAVQ